MRLLLILVVLMTPALVWAKPPGFVGKWKLSSVRTKNGPVPKVVTWKVKSGKLDIAGTGTSTVVMTFVKSK